MIKKTLLKDDAKGGWQTMMIANARKDQNCPYVGRRMDEIGRSVGKDSYETSYCVRRQRIHRRIWDERG